MGKIKDLTGQRFGRLVVIEDSGERRRNHVVWKCQCDCGNIAFVVSECLKRGNTKSCGCLNTEKRIMLGKSHATHGMTNSRIYRIWKRMKVRCYNRNDNDFKDYGAKGITVCDEWKNDFISFYQWSMNNGYSDKLTIDRIDVHGNYEPSNCRWVDLKVQANNKTNNHLITINGETKTAVQWCREYNISRSTFGQRLRAGKTGQDLIATPRGKKDVVQS